MLNAEKIRLMTDLAIYEKHNQKNVFKINDYYKRDYIMGQMLSAFFRYTFCFLMLFILYLAFRVDTLFYNINLNGITKTFNTVGILYLAGFILYELITYFVSAKRYEKAKRGILLYATKLKRLGRKYHYMKKREAE